MSTPRTMKEQALSKLARLRTHEDKMDIHKILGAAVLLHFAFRMWCFVRSGGSSMGFRANDWTSVLSVVPHALLPVSGLMFRVLPERLRRTPLLIWEEMRLHSLVFTLRSVVVFVACWLDPSWWTQLAVRPLLVLVSHLAADAVTARYGRPGSTTIRVEGADKRWVETVFKRFYSLSQMAAIAALLTPGASGLGMDRSFAILCGVQLAAFGMTLRKKNILGRVGYNTFYTLSLFYAGAVMAANAPIRMPVLVCGVMLLRVLTDASKYSLWGGYVLLDSLVA